MMIVAISLTNLMDAHFTDNLDGCDILWQHLPNIVLIFFQVFSGYTVFDIALYIRYYAAPFGV